MIPAIGCGGRTGIVSDGQADVALFQDLRRAFGDARSRTQKIGAASRFASALR
jgi:hypothetical protein